MTSVLELVGDVLGDRGLLLHKAVPRCPAHLLLDVRGPDDVPVAGQWFADADDANRAAIQTLRASPDAKVTLLGSNVLLQPSGADRTLRSLHHLAAAPGAELVAHRPEQRAVVRHTTEDAPTYTKMVRPKRWLRTLRGAQLRAPQVRLPQVLSADGCGATVTCAELPGRTLFEILGDPTTTEAEVARAGSAVGSALARLHTAPVPTDLERHGPEAEHGVTSRWVALATAHGAVPRLPRPAARLLEQVGRWLDGPPSLPVLLHRDLHDKQVLLHDDAVGMLDFDLAATGEASLDLANLLVHLELRALQGHCTLVRASSCAAAVVEGYRPNPGVRSRLAAYQLSTRLRLACVYGFRPTHAHVGTELLTPGPTGSFTALSVLEESLS